MVAVYQRQNLIIVGGTGLYINALLEGVNVLPARSLKTKWDEASLQECLKELAVIDPESALKIKDKRRAIRALDIFDITGLTLTQWFAKPKKKLLQKNFYKIFTDKENLDERIMKRLTNDLENMIQEVNEEKDMILNSKLENTIGFKDICDFLNNKTDKTTLINNIFFATRQYAKRQRTWFRKYYNYDQKI